MNHFFVVNGSIATISSIEFTPTLTLDHGNACLFVVKFVSRL